MSEPSAIDAASRRLALALDALEAAVERRREADRGEQRWTPNCMRSAPTAPGSPPTRCRGRPRAGAGDHQSRVAQRLDAAIDTIRSVLEANER